MPQTVVSGCLFHFCKAVHSQVQKKGLIELYNKDAEFQTCLALLYGLTYVPIDNVVQVFEEVVAPAFEECLPGEDDEGVDGKNIEKFMEYVEKYYVGCFNIITKSRRDPVFPLLMWNSVPAVLDDEPLTNNSVESWNARWNA